MKTCIKIVTIFVALLLVNSYGCSVNKPIISRDLQISFQDLIPIRNMNKSLQVTIESLNRDDLKFGSVIHVVVNNLSNQHILVPEPDGIRLFIIRDNKWLEINNDVEYYGNSEGPILYPNGPYELRDRVSIWIRPILEPEIESLRNQEILRIVIIGELMSDDEKTNISSGAYTDLFISP